MGFLDSVKKALGGEAAKQASLAATQVVNKAAPAPAAPPPVRAAAPVPVHPPAPQRPDTAAFDLPREEEAFFAAVLHMETNGENGGTDASRAEIMQRFAIRDRAHWQNVKAAAYHVLIGKHGSIDAVMQREMNWRAGETQRKMQAKIAAKASSGELGPVEGIGLETWAALNASIAGGANFEDLLKGAGIDKGRWDRASAEWTARMSRDTTFAIATVYGNAFQNASKGKFAAYAKEAVAARADNRDLALAPPITLEQFWELMYEQSFAAKQGRDPIAALKDAGLTVVDWADLGSFMGYFFNRTWMANVSEYTARVKAVEARLAAKYPGVQADVDLSF